MDLSNSQNWLLVTVQGKAVTDVSTHPIYKRKYIPLEPSEIQVTSPVLQIYLDSEDALPNWRNAGWANLFVQMNGRSTRVGHQVLILRETNFLNFPYFGEELVPFLLRIDFPWWIKDITFQVWEFQDNSGRYVQSGVAQALADLEERMLGETVQLSSVGYSNLIDGGTVLQQSVFVGSTKYERYEVGRFYRKDTGEKLSDPILTVRSGSFTATFTGLEKLPTDVIVVSVKPL